MTNYRQLGILLLSILVLITLMVFLSNVLSEGQNSDLAGAEFLVSWFDVGEEVLEGLKGVELVNSGYHGSMETNAVLYDPALILVDQIENVLKETGIYLGTVKWKIGSG